MFNGSSANLSNSTTDPSLRRSNSLFFNSALPTSTVSFTSIFSKNSQIVLKTKFDRSPQWTSLFFYLLFYLLLYIIFFTIINLICYLLNLRLIFTVACPDNSPNSLKNTNWSSIKTLKYPPTYIEKYHQS